MKERAQCWRWCMREKIDTQTREDSGASSGVNGGGPALSAWVAEECNRVSGQELTEAEERVRADLAQRAKERELEAWGRFKGLPPAKMGAKSKEMADTRWVLAWKEVGGAKTVAAR